MVHPFPQYFFQTFLRIVLNAIGRAGKSDGSDKEEADQWEHHSRHFTIIVYACSLGAYRKVLDVKIWNYTTYVDYVLKSLRVSNMEEFLYEYQTEKSLYIFLPEKGV